MTNFLKIAATIIFYYIWGLLHYGCQQLAMWTASGLGYGLVNTFGFVLFGAGIYGIWKYNPSKTSDSENQKLDKS